MLPGDIVRVPFGPRELQGIVFSLSGATPVEETRPLTERAEIGPFISGDRLTLARWLAAYYRTTLYAAAALMLPAGATSRPRVWLTRAKVLPEPVSELNQLERRAWDATPEEGRARRDRVLRRLGRPGRAVVDRLVRRGFLLARSELEHPSAAAVYQSRAVLNATPDEARTEAAKWAGTRSARRGELLTWLADGNEGGTRQALADKFGLASVNWLLKGGLLRLEKVQVQRDPLARYAVQGQFPPEPTPEQASAVAEIEAALSAARPGAPPARLLLFGVTGSGKTEVYLRAVEACLRAGKRAIVLVPEIALTPQALRRFASRFPGKVALQHSGMPAGERYDQWWRVRAGDYPVVLGSRSAVFAPADDLGLVVIDEEHEWTYKQADQAPRYHAREVAERLCATTGAVLLCGSATPDLGTFRRAERGEYRLLRLPNRVAASSVPVGVFPAVAPDGPARAAPPGLSSASQGGRTRIVDMREELRAGHAEVLSRDLIAALRETLVAGGSAVLFLNRRGVASFVQCKECGAVRRCRRCDTTLVYHRPERGPGPGRLVCHYCGYQVNSARACRSCGGNQVLRLGAGTQAVADAVQSYFPGAGVVRWDSDSARTAKEHEAVLERFESKGGQVLVGTQVVAKGLDMPAVTLVGIVAADIGLAVPDFRAAERTFQLVSQAAGRTGRGSRRGRVIIQTFQPEHYAIKAAAAEDYESFYRTEIEIRARHAYPPLSRLVRLLFSDPDLTEATRVAGELGARLRRERAVSGDTSNDVLGPTPAYPLRVRGRYRWQVVLRGPAPEALLDRVPPGRGWVVDVDPVSLA